MANKLLRVLKQVHRDPSPDRRSAELSVFPNAAGVVALVERLVHCSEILTLASNSYRLKEAQERWMMAIAVTRS